MFYGSSSGASMSLPSKSRLKRQSRTFTQVLYRTLSYRDRVPAETGTNTRGDRRSATEPPERPADDPAELSTQSSAPGVLKIFGDEICAGANYKSVLATPRSSAQELVKEALDRYSLNKDAAHSYVLCDVIGRLEGGGGVGVGEVVGDGIGGGGGWRTECLRALGDNEKPLLLQELWKPREGHARRFELRKRAELGVGEEPKRYYSTLPGPFRGREHEAASSGRRKEEGSHGGGGVRHSLYQSPHLLLLQGFNRQHTVGQETPSARPNICLFSPDILPLHCCLRRVPASRRNAHNNNKGEEVTETQRFCVAVEPVLHATVLVNFSRCEHSTTLRHGDLLSFGAHYIFLYKDPTGAKPLPAQTLARLRTLGQLYDAGVEEGEGGAQTCKMCGSMLKDRAAQVSSAPAVRRSFKPHLVKPRSGGTAAGGPLKLSGGEGRGGGGGGQKRRLQLEFDQAHEDQLLNRILSLIEPGGDDHKLTPAYLLCLCIQHSASTFPPGSFGKLLLKIVRRIQTIAWMTSCGEKPGSKESLLSATISANEEAMTILEEVIMYTFQQCVYYITKALYVVLPGLLDCNPFPVDSSEPCWKGGVGFPEPVRRVLQRSKVLQIQACLRMVMEWASRSGLGHLADKFFTKLNSTVSILATAPQQLTQLSWRALSSEHPTLKPVQLHRILTQYQLTVEIGPVPIWQPSSEDEAYIYRTVDLLESFENHPPIVLPSAGFRVDLDSECVEDSIYRQLLYIRHYLWGLRTKTQTHTNTPSVHTHSNGTNTADWPDVQRELLPAAHSSPRSGGPGDEVTAESGEERVRDRPSGQPHTHSLRRNGTIHHPRTANPDLSCLLTPPNTPLYPEGGGGGPGPIIGPNTQTNGCTSRTVAESKKTNGLITNGLEVELDKGPYGLGMGLIDGLHTPLNAPGIYIRTLIPDGPAASDGRLRIGDRILAVNGTSLIGADYQSAVDLIRLGGGRLRFLVAKSDPEVSEKISASSC
ncbi:hypothetical protein PAMP_021331 [Pampus punctatissimus]